MKRAISLILIFTNTTLLFSQMYWDEVLGQYMSPGELYPGLYVEETIYFKSIYKIDSSDKISGELINIKLNQELDPMTGFTSQVVFKPKHDFQVPSSFSGGTTNDGQYYIFNAKDIRKIDIKIIRKRKNRFYIFSPLPKIFVWSKELYSDEMQKEYSGREEIDLIINNGMKKISQIEKDEIRGVKTLVNIGCAGLSIMLYLALSCGGNC
tara:strand:- start:37 stop:663 length:627 start_codon:yes stop_codon:yes gene_type:complete